MKEKSKVYTVNTSIHIPDYFDPHDIKVIKINVPYGVRPTEAFDLLAKVKKEMEDKKYDTIS